MATDDIKRLYFYERQFLRTRDFQDEQAYHIEMRRRPLIAHHTWGIVVGLEIKQDATSKIWSVQPGMAVDGFGREIVVFAPKPLDTNQIARQLAGVTTSTNLNIWLDYQVERTNRPAPGYEVCDQKDQFTRVRETFRLIYQDGPPTRDQTMPPQPYEDLPDDPGLAPWPVYLGTITWDPSQKVITHVDFVDLRDNKSRRYVGLVGAEIFSPKDTRTLDVHASKTTFDQDIVVKGTTGDGFGRLRLDVDNTDASVITNKKAPTPTDPNPPSGDIYLRTNNESGGKKIIIDKDTLQAKTAQISQDLTVNGNLGIGATNLIGRLTINGIMQPQQGVLTFFSQDADIVYDGGSDGLFVFKDTGGKTAFIGGNVGIGTTDPRNPLGVRAKGQSEELISFEDSTGTTKWHINQNLGGNKPGLNFVETGVADGRLFIKAGGNVGIGTTNPLGKLTVEAPAHINVIFDRTDTQDHMTLTVGSVGTGIHFSDGNRFFISADPYSERNTGGFGNEVLTILPSGNVGIGTTSPAGRLTLKGIVEPQQGLLTFFSNTADIEYDGGSDGSFIFRNTAANGRTAFTGGNVGIGRIPTTNELEVEGDASKTIAGSWLANSDIRIKKDIQAIENAMEVINKLHPIKFRYTEEYRAKHSSIEDKYYCNFIAQEFREVFPESVHEDGDGFLQIDIHNVTPYLVAAVQELAEAVKELKAENKGLKQRIEVLERAMEEKRKKSSQKRSKPKAGSSTGE